MGLELPEDTWCSWLHEMKSRLKVRFLPLIQDSRLSFQITFLFSVSLVLFLISLGFQISNGEAVVMMTYRYTPSRFYVHQVGLGSAQAVDHLTKTLNDLFNRYDGQHTRSSW